MPFLQRAGQRTAWIGQARRTRQAWCPYECCTRPGEWGEGGLPRGSKGRNCRGPQGAFLWIARSRTQPSLQCSHAALHTSLSHLTPHTSNTPPHTSYSSC